MQDVNMIMSINTVTHGGLSLCFSRYSEANNKLMTEYNPGDPSRYLLYLEVNSLYGTLIGKPLPFDGFE